MREPLFPRFSGRSIRYLVFAKMILAILLGPGFLGADPLIHNDYEYELDGDEVIILRYLGIDEQVTIPSQILGMPVTRIKSGTFSSHHLKAVAVEIPDSVTTVDSFAFESIHITSVFIGSGVTSLGDRPFDGFSPLEEIIVSENNPVFSSQDGVLLSKDGTTLIRLPCARSGTFTVPTNIHRIGPGAFSYAVNLVEILLPDNLTEIGDSAFSRCISLSSITIPESVISIGDFAFWRCISLSSITIPENVVGIGNGILAMDHQSSSQVEWVTIQVADGNPAYSSVDGILFDKEMTTLVQFPPGLSPFSEYAIPDGITEIRPFAFSGNALRVDITLPDSLTHIGRNAFSYSRMRSVVLSEKVVSIGDRAFYECSLWSIVIPDSVESIGKFAFYRNFILDVVSFGSSLRFIDEYAFSRTMLGREIRFARPPGFQSYKPGHLTLPSGLIHIGTGAFFRNEWLAEVTLPESLETIGDWAFHGCGGLQEFHIAEHNPNFTVESGVLFDKSGETLLFFPHGFGDEYHIPPTVTSIAAGAFHGHLASRIVVPASVRYIGARAFGHFEWWGPSHASIFFLGDAPTTVGHEAFASGRHAKFWYIQGKTSWEDILPNDNMHILTHPVFLLGTQSGPNGWHTLNGFGMFFPNLFSDWLFHTDHGWIFFQPVSFEGFRIYFPRSELWATMSSPLLPWFYVHSPVDSWVFFEFGDDGPTLVLP